MHPSRPCFPTSGPYVVCHLQFICKCEPQPLHLKSVLCFIPEKGKPTAGHQVSPPKPIRLPATQVEPSASEGLGNAPHKALSHLVITEFSSGQLMLTEIEISELRYIHRIQSSLHLIKEADASGVTQSSSEKHMMSGANRDLARKMSDDVINWIKSSAFIFVDLKPTRV